MKIFTILFGFVLACSKKKEETTTTTATTTTTTTKILQNDVFDLGDDKILDNFEGSVEI